MNTKTIAIENYSLFRKTLREALQAKIVRLPPDLQYEYREGVVYRGVRITETKRDLSDEDFRSQIERNLPGFAKDEIENYSCSVFGDAEDLEKAYKLPRKNKGIAKGVLKPNCGPCQTQAGDSHVQWYLYADAHLETKFEVVSHEAVDNNTTIGKTLR